MNSLARELAERIGAAAAAGTPLALVGGGSKPFLGHPGVGETLSLAGYAGVVHYEPTELVLTARAGTPLREIEQLLAAHGQMLAFEPPHYGAGATLGGTIACGLSGPRRAYAGAARDFVLGVRCINGRGEILRFGGEVMKNVAGYDLARLMCGAFGTLGALLEISLKVLPCPERELTLGYGRSPDAAIADVNHWAGTPLPISATACEGGRLYVRLSGTARGVEAARSQLGGEPEPDAAAFWDGLREHRRAFFTGDDPPLWRLSVAPASAPIGLPGTWLYEWGGALRWLRSSASAEAVQQAAHALGGHATLWRGGNAQAARFAPLPPGLMQLHSRLKQAFDPARILNPGKLYPEL